MMLLNKYTIVLLCSTVTYVYVAYVLLLNPFYSENMLHEDVVLICASILVLSSAFIYNIAMFASERERKKNKSA